MNLHRSNGGDIKPCKHMETLVSNRVDDRLKGLAKAYTDWHVSQCPRCQAGMQTLTALKDRLRDLDLESGGMGLPADKWDSVEARWQSVDAAGRGE